jgi:hypothetical protein
VGDRRDGSLATLSALVLGPVDACVVRTLTDSGGRRNARAAASSYDEAQHGGHLKNDNSE